MKIPELQEGERYAGVILNEDGTLSHHLILLPKQPTKLLTWNEAVVWAQDGLPTRQEQSLLFANCKDAFEPTWYWSSEQYADYARYAHYAWTQDFDNGDQLTTAKSFPASVRAVRRVHI